MKNYLNEAKEKAGNIEKYALENGVAVRRYIDGKLILVFRALYDAKHQSVVYYNCSTHKFCNCKGQ